jgi:hypothetical protein
MRARYDGGHNILYTLQIIGCIILSYWTMMYS